MSKHLFHGVLLINKQQTWTSHDVVQKIRHLLNQKSVGHAGTLDPLAEGLLVILLGNATKLSPYFLNANKRYHINMKFGITTSTYDLEGEKIIDQEVSLKEQDIKNLLEKNTKNLQLSVPYFSAVKVKGKKLYNYARENESVEVPVKEMSFYDLEIHNITKDSATVSVSCSKGSYIRSWVHHLGEQIQTGACLMNLKRLNSGQFNIDNSLTIPEFEKKLEVSPPKNNQELKDLLLSDKSFLFPKDALPDFPSIELTRRDGRSLFYGRIPAYIITESQESQIKVNKENSYQILKVIQEDSLIALLELKPFQKLKVLRRFPLQNR